MRTGANRRLWPIREVHGRVAARATAVQRRVGAACSSTSTSSTSPTRRAFPLNCHALDDVDESLDALALHLIRYLIGHRCRLGAAARRTQADAPSSRPLPLGAGVVKVAVGLTREADDEVGGEGEVGDRCAETRPRDGGTDRGCTSRMRFSTRVEPD